MSDKTYTAEQVAIEVLKKYSELAKAEACKAEEVEKTESKAKDKEKGVHKPHFMAGKKTGTSEVGAYQGGGKLHPDTVAWAKEKHKQVMEESSKIKPNLPKSEQDVEKCGEMKEMKKADDSKLKAFLENKKAKKTSKMEKMLGMNQAPAQTASTGVDAPKPKINMPGDKQK
jgi:hypothetical protein